VPRRIRPVDTVQGSAACHARSTNQPAGPWPSGPVQPRRCPAAWEWGTHRAHSRRRGGTASPRGPADKVSQKRRREHREGNDAPDEVVAERAHPSSGSTCGGGVEAAW
jgi:hypothetical protein